MLKERQQGGANDPGATLFNAVNEVHELIQYGNSPSFLSEKELISRGFGHCGQFVELLSNRLRAMSVEHEVVVLLARNGASHEVVEALIGSNRYTLDPTLGVAYQGGVVDLVRDPALAVPYAGTISGEQRKYGGIGFFEQVALVARQGLSAALFDATEYGKKQLNSGVLVVSWPDGLDVHQVNLTFSEATRLRLREWDSEIPIPGFSTKGVVPPKGSSSLSIQVTEGGKKRIENFEVALLATRESGRRILPIYAPLATYVAFEGGAGLIDSVELMGSTKTFFNMDVGVLGDEKGSGRFLFAPEFFSTPVNSWGKIIELQGVTYREVDSSIQASSAHAAIQVAPLIAGIEEEHKFQIRVCYLNADDESGRTKIKIFDVAKNEYVYLGVLSVGEFRRCDNFSVPTSVIRATLGHK